MDLIRMFIDGAWVNATDGATRQVLDPGTGRAIASIAWGGDSDARTAIDAAHRAFETTVRDWTPAERASLLRRTADELEKVADETMLLESQNQGWPLSQLDGTWAPRLYRYYADLVEAQAAEGPEVVGDRGSYVVREPVGVVGIITPWNNPFFLAAGRAGAAIAAGCTVVLKPASLTPLTALRLAAAFEAAGAPHGLVNVIVGPAETVGRALISDGRISKVSFTGGIEAGREIARTAIGDMKRLTMELGGKSPNIVLDDADLGAAAEGATWGIFCNSGEVCSAGSRLLLQRSVARETLERVIARTRELTVGYQLEPSTDMGPLISAAHLAHVSEYVRIGIDEGATLVLGGKSAAVHGYEGGFYFEPTIFTDVQPQMRIAREEIFGPVLAVLEFDSDAEALAMANDTDYGLAAGVWSSDPDRWGRFANRLDVGLVFANSYHSATFEVPWGGMKHSGFGREHGSAGIGEYQELKAIVRAG